MRYFSISTHRKLAKITSSTLLMISGKLEPRIPYMCYISLLVSNQRTWKLFLTMCKTYLMHSMLAKYFCESIWLLSRNKNQIDPFTLGYLLIIFQEKLVDITFIPKGFDNFKYLSDAKCEITNFVLTIPIKTRAVHIVAEDLIH